MSRWPLRDVPAPLAARYLGEGHWDDTTLGSTLDAAVRAHGDQPFRIWSDVRPFTGTIGEVGSFARRLAGGLRSAGVLPGDVVTLQAPNWMEAVAAVWAAAFAGAIVVPLIDAHGPDEVRAILAETGARVHLAPRLHRDRSYVEEVLDAAPGLPELAQVWPLESIHERLGTELISPLPVDPGTPVVLCYTSGTSAAPKGVIHTHRTFLAEVRQQMARRWPDSIDRDLVASPVGHMAGLVRMVVMPVLRGHPVYGADRWQPQEILHIVRRHGLTTASGVPYFIRSLLEHPDFSIDDVEHVRHVGTGGAPIPEAIMRDAAELGISIVRGYGSTEHPTVANSSHDDPWDQRSTTEGRPFVGVEVRLLHDGVEVGPGQEGELWTRGPDLCMGYVDGEQNVVFDAEGWFETGDRAMLDPSGSLVILGRSKDIVIRGGENISAAFVERALMKLPFVVEAAVVAGPDERFGERVCAFVTCTPGSDGESDGRSVDLQRVRSALADAGVSRLAWPEQLHVVDAIPRSEASKIDKNELRMRAARQAQQAGEEPWPTTTTTTTTRTT